MLKAKHLRPVGRGKDRTYPQTSGICSIQWRDQGGLGAVAPLTFAKKMRNRCGDGVVADLSEE